MRTIETIMENSQRSLSRTSAGTGTSTMNRSTINGACIAKYNDMTVYITRVTFRLDAIYATRQMSSLMQEIKQLNHPNINRFIGICNHCELTNCPVIVHLFCRRGSLSKLLITGLLDWDMKFSLAKDLAEAINVVHQSTLRFHGNIKFNKCLVDEYFGLKLTHTVTEKLKLLCPLEIKEKKPRRTRHNICTAPEQLRGGSSNSTTDMYAVGVIASQLLETGMDEVLPFHEYGQQVDFAYSERLEILLNLCTSDAPTDRPTAKSLLTAFQACVRSEEHSGSLFDVLMSRLQRHAARLEDIVRERMHDLVMEKERCDGILGQILPRKVVQILRQGLPVEPEFFEKVSILFSDVGDFVQFVQSASPFEIVDLLHAMYSAFDVTVCQHKVYKVETIGDSYMVASGLPEDIGDEHANETCRLALDLQRTFRNIPNEHNLKLRVGAHSGSVAAGVVGFRQPRYCLFGDVVNVASRMLSTGSPTKIQLSYATVALASHNEFRFEERGVIDVKTDRANRSYTILMN